MMCNTDCEDFLCRHGIRPTANRIMIVKALHEAGRPMSIAELESRLPSIDKSNIFRALSVFSSGHMVHRIEDGGEGVRYELCLSHEEGHDDDMHAHFYCEICHKTFCLEELHVDNVNVPSGYEVHSVNYVIKGICPNCSHKI